MEALPNICNYALPPPRRNFPTPSHETSMHEPEKVALQPRGEFHGVRQSQVRQSHARRRNGGGGA